MATAVQLRAAFELAPPLCSGDRYFAYEHPIQRDQ